MYCRSAPALSPRTQTNGPCSMDHLSRRCFQIGFLYLSPQPVLASHDVLAGGLVLILTALREGGEIILDGVQGGRIGREKQQGRTRRCDEAFRHRHKHLFRQSLKMLASYVPSKSTGSANRPSMRAIRSDVRGRRCPETRPSTRWPLRAYPYRRAVDDTHPHSPMSTGCL